MNPDPNPRKKKTKILQMKGSLGDMMQRKGKKKKGWYDDLFPQKEGWFT